MPRLLVTKYSPTLSSPVFGVAKKSEGEWEIVNLRKERIQRRENVISQSKSHYDRHMSRSVRLGVRRPSGSKKDFYIHRAGSPIRFVLSYWTLGALSSAMWFASILNLLTELSSSFPPTHGSDVFIVSETLCIFALHSDTEFNIQ
jgi:hypothetical protein